MITTSKNNSFICVEEVCEPQNISCAKSDDRTEQQFPLFRKFLGELWAGMRQFLGTDRWNRAVTLQRGDSHYTMKMEDIEARWRNR